MLSYFLVTHELADLLFVLLVTPKEKDLSNGGHFAIIQRGGQDLLGDIGVHLKRQPEGVEAIFFIAS